MKYTFNFSVKSISKDNEKIYNWQGRFFLSKRFKDFEQEIGAQAIAQLPKGFKVLEGQISVRIVFMFMDNRRRDLLNLPKSFCDALNGIVWQDDSQIYYAKVGKLLGQEKEGIILDVENFDEMKAEGKC